MRAARVHEFGAAVVVEDVPAPVPGAGEVVVDVQAAAVNFTDLLISRGEYQMRADPPLTLGSELAGVVSAVGPGVEGIAIGDRLVGATLVGAFAEQVVLPAAAASVVPEGVEARDAAAFSIAYGTSYSALRSVAAVQRGETLVVLGAAGGVGLAAVEIGAHLGARVIAAASTDEKLDLCRQHGASETINYATENLKERMKELTDGGAHVVIDPVGGDLTEPALRATRFGGRFVVVGFASGEIPRVPLNLVLLKGFEIRAFEIWSFRRYRPDDAARDHREMMDLLATGTLRPYVSATFPLDSVTEALAEIGDRRATGKVIIEP